MKKLEFFISITTLIISMYFGYIYHKSENTHNDSKYIYDKSKADSNLLSGDTDFKTTDLTPENNDCQEINYLLSKVDNDVNERKKELLKLSNFMRDYKSSESVKSYIFQSLGFTHYSYLKNRNRSVAPLNSLIVVDDGVEILPVKDELAFVKTVTNSRMDEISNLIGVMDLNKNTIVEGQPIISYILNKNNSLDELDIVNFIKNHRDMINFYDLYTATKLDQSVTVIRELVNSYNGKIDVVWDSDYTKNNLATLSAQHGRVDLVQFWADRGIPLEVYSNNKRVNTILDSFSSLQKDPTSAKGIFEISFKNNLMPAGYYSYLFFSNLSKSFEKEEKDYLNDILISFTSKHNLTNLPSPINDSFTKLLSLNSNIEKLSSQINRCHYSKRHVSDGKLKVSNILDESGISTTEKDGPVDQTTKEIMEFLGDSQILLKEKNFDEYVKRISIKSRSIAPDYLSGFLSLALVDLANNNVPDSYIGKVIIMGGVPNSELIILLGVNNNYKSIRKVSSFDFDIKLNPNQTEKIFMLHESGKLNDETLEALKLANYVQ